jgi:hypothetical protein
MAIYAALARAGLGCGSRHLSLEIIFKVQPLVQAETNGSSHDRAEFGFSKFNQAGLI